jgi:drug/metabolite transporter (DMT)-like permease
MWYYPSYRTIDKPPSSHRRVRPEVKLRPLSPAPENIALGVIVIVATGFAMAFGDALVKRISADFTLPQIFVLRSLVAIAILLGLLLARHRPQDILPKAIRWALLRSLLLVGMWICFCAALPVLSLPVVAAAYYTGPIFIALLSALVIREPVGLWRWAAILLGFVGVVAILRPGTDAFSYLTLLPIGSAAFYALAAVVTRARCSMEKPLALAMTLNASLLAAGMIAAAAIAAWDPAASQRAAYPFLFGPWAAMDGHAWSIIGLLAVLMVGVSAGVAKAYQSGPPAIIATFDYAYLVFAAFWSFVFFAELPDAVTIAGMLLIAGGGLLAMRCPAGTRRAFAAEITEGS